MAVAVLSIKLRCASWQQLATIYKRDLSRGTMFLRAANPPPIGTEIRVDLTLPSASVIVLNGVVAQHVEDPQRGAGVEIKLAPIPAGSVWMIESALASENKVRAATAATPAGGTPTVPPAAGSPASHGAPPSGHTGPIATLSDGAEVASAEHELIRALQSEAESLKKLNPFLVLGVGYETNDSDVRAAFGDLTKRYHPDRFARYQSAELRQVAAEIFILIRDAYRRLGDETSRAQVLGSLGRVPAPRAVPGPRAPTAQVPPPPRPGQPRAGTPALGVRTDAVPPPVPRLPRPETSVDSAPPPPPPPLSNDRAERGERPSRVATEPARPPESPPPREHARPATPDPVRQPAAVTTPMRPPTAPPPPLQTDRRPVLVQPAAAITENSDPAVLETLLDAGKFEEAIAAYKLLAKKNPSDRPVRAGIELCEGLRALANRDRLEAAQRFESALEIDPSNERAARELADMRRQATNERKGLLSRLMGKKE